MDLQTGTRYTSYEAYLQDHPIDSNLPTVAVIFYSGTTLTSNLQGGAELLQTLQQQANLLPFFSDGIATADAIQEHLFRNGCPVCDGMVSLLRFSLDGGPLGGNPEKKPSTSCSSLTFPMLFLSVPTTKILTNGTKARCVVTLGLRPTG